MALRMSPVAELLADTFGRVRDQVPHVVGGLDLDELAWRPDPGSNSVAWLVWHLTRIEDDHIAEVAGTEQVWTSAGWYDRFGLPFPPEAHGWGHTAEEVAQVRVAADLLAGYHADVAQRVIEYVGTLTPDDLERVVDDHWDPPVTLGVRLVSVVGDAHQHIGQAAYLRGLLERR
jgi:uncharacterized damage-inducible protein DinB